MTASPLVIGIGAGIVAAVLFASLATNTALAVLLFYVTPLPLFLARLGWGRLAGQIAFLTAIVLISFIIGLRTAVLYGLAVGLPAMLLSHLALLSRAMVPQDPEGRSLPGMPAVTEWYPPGHIIAWTAVLSAGLVALGLFLLTGTAEVYNDAVRKAFQEIILPQLQSAGVTLDTARSENLITMISRVLLPAASAIAWMFIMLANLWLAGKAASISGLLPRPWPAIGNLEYPPLMTVGFVASAGLALLPGLPGILAMSFVGGFAFAYLLLGLVVLHQVIADSALKPLLLIGIYLAIVIVNWAALAVALVGLAEPVLELRQRALRRSAPPKGGGKTPSKE